MSLATTCNTAPSTITSPDISAVVAAILLNLKAIGLPETRPRADASIVNVAIKDVYCALWGF